MSPAKQDYRINQKKNVSFGHCGIDCDTANGIHEQSFAFERPHPWKQEPISILDLNLTRRESAL